MKKIMLSIILMGLILNGCGSSSDDSDNLVKQEFEKNINNEHKSFDEKENTSDTNTSDTNYFDKENINSLKENILTESSEFSKNFGEKAKKYGNKALKATKEAASTAYAATKTGISNGAEWSKNYAKDWFAKTWEDSKKDYAEQKAARKKAKEEVSDKKQ